jgi:hypothetical protein
MHLNNKTGRPGIELSGDFWEVNNIFACRENIFALITESMIHGDERGRSEAQAATNK